MTPIRLTLGLIATVLSLVALAVTPAFAQSPPSGPSPPETDPPGRLDSLEKWRRADDVLLRSAERFIAGGERRRALLERHARERDRFSPGDMSPSAVRARRALSALAAQYDDSLRETRRARDAVIRAVAAAILSEQEIAPLLARRLSEIQSTPEGSLSAQDRHEVERLRRWIRGLERAQSGGPGQFAGAVIGFDLAREMMGAGRRDLPSEPQRPPPAPPVARMDFGPPAGSPPSAASDPDHAAEQRRRIERRIQFLEAQNRRAEEESARRDQQIRFLSRMLRRLESGLDDDSSDEPSGPASADPPPAGPSLP